jgi:integrase
MQFWTLDEFNKAIAYEDKPAFHLCFMILFWCGLRKGECLALTPQKIFHDTKSLNVTETFHRVDGEDIFGPPKTDNGIRTVHMPDFVYNELTRYIESIYGIKENEKIFFFAGSAMNKELDYLAETAGVKRIRVHDLRHSHVSLLIKLGYRTHEIADRIGDTPEVVDRTYAHLYPSTSLDIARELDKHKNGIIDDNKKS